MLLIYRDLQLILKAWLCGFCYAGDGDCSPSPISPQSSRNPLTFQTQTPLSLPLQWLQHAHSKFPSAPLMILAPALHHPPATHSPPPHIHTHIPPFLASPLSETPHQRESPSAPHTHSIHHHFRRHRHHYRHLRHPYQHLHHQHHRPQLFPFGGELFTRRLCYGEK